MAESNRGPMIALHQNACCCQFTVNRKYRETVDVLRNFIQQKVNEITFGNHKDKAIAGTQLGIKLQEAINMRRVTKNVNHDDRVQNDAERLFIKAMLKRGSSAAESDQSKLRNLNGYSTIQDGDQA